MKGKEGFKNSEKKGFSEKEKKNCGEKKKKKKSCDLYGALYAIMELFK